MEFGVNMTLHSCPKWVLGNVDLDSIPCLVRRVALPTGTSRVRQTAAEPPLDRCNPAALVPSNSATWFCQRGE